jgi:transcriptional regulator
MYVPGHFRIDDEAELHAFMHRFSFATLVSVIDGRPFATHLPLLLEMPEGAPQRLLGHIARGNPHRTALESGAETLAIFQGDHAYVSPAWYETQPAVPTWNYTAVHATGRPRLMTEDELREFVGRLTAHFEAGANPASPYEVPEATRDGLLRGIVGFVMDIEAIEGKYKLSQNRSAADQQGVSEHLLASGDQIEQQLGRLMSNRLREG